MADFPWVQLITAAAAIGGGVTVGLLNRWNQRAQLAEQERVRYHERRIEAYARFVSAGDELISVGTKDPDSFDDVIPASKLFDECYVQVELLATPSARHAADVYHRAATDVMIGFHLLFKEGGPPDLETREKFDRMHNHEYEHAKESRAAFIDAARKERGIRD